MKFIKRSLRSRPKVSLVLLDWSVRESFHLLHYLSRQSIPRDSFEVIIIEYYDRVSEALRRFEEQVDSWVVLEMPAACYYHKHLMYNVGIVLARGEIVMIGDSDAMVKETFIESIIRHFERNPDTVYHIDQFRNVRRDLYPFSYPSFEEVLGEGCMNNAGGKTAGVLNNIDPIHSRNYGSCMCARREDLIAIGGADMHIDYLGHICGPYDMTFRLVNFGRREVWDMNEFMYHTWHPGQAGADNFMGPHDGRHMSTTALEALQSGRVLPLLENEAIRLLRTAGTTDPESVIDKLIPAASSVEWSVERIKAQGSHARWDDYKRPLGIYKGFRLVAEVDRVFAYPLTERHPEQRPGQGDGAPFEGTSVEEAKRRIDAATPFSLSVAMRLAGFWALSRRAMSSLIYRSRSLPLPLPSVLKVPLAGLMFAPALVLYAICRPKALRDRLRRAWDLEVRAAEWTHAAAALYNLMRWGGLMREPGQVAVFVGGPYDGTLVRVLCALARVPRCMIGLARDLDELARSLDELEDRHWKGTILIPNGMHARLHAAVSGRALESHLIVV